MDTVRAAGLLAGWDEQADRNDSQGRKARTRLGAGLQVWEALTGMTLADARAIAEHGDREDRQVGRSVPTTDPTIVQHLPGCSRLAGWGTCDCGEDSP